MANDPWTGARLGANTDNPQNGGGFFAEVVNEMGKWTVPSFSTAAARDAALANWKNNGNTAVDGMRCRTANDKQTWVLTGGSWVWPSEAQGQLGRADYRDATGSNNGMTLLANSPTGLPAFNVNLPTILPGRHIKATFSGQIMCVGSAPTAYAFVINTGGFQHRGVIQMAMAGSTASPIPQEFNITYSFDTTATISNATAGIQSGSLWAGSGTCYLVSKSGDLDAPTQLLVEDMGAA